MNFDTNYELKVMSCLNNNLDFKEDNKTKNQAMSSDNNKITLDKLKNRIEYLYEEK